MEPHLLHCLHVYSKDHSICLVNGAPPSSQPRHVYLKDYSLCLINTACLNFLIVCVCLFIRLCNLFCKRLFIRSLNLLCKHRLIFFTAYSEDYSVHFVCAASSSLQSVHVYSEDYSICLINTASFFSYSVRIYSNDCSICFVNTASPSSQSFQKIMQSVL